jgi:hypothetical protein
MSVLQQEFSFCTCDAILSPLDGRTFRAQGAGGVVGVQAR